MAQTAIAAKTGVSVRSVRRIEDEPAMSSSDTAALIRARGVGRPSLAAPWTLTVERWLQDDRTLPSGEIIRRLREDHGYRGGKSALYELIRRLRPVPIAPLVRFEGVPGEFSQHDFGLVSVRYVSGVVERVRFFASRLKWSRFVDVTLVPDEREEALIRGLLHALEAFRGVPLVTVWDNPKTVVLARKGELIVWNPVFGQVALDDRFAPELCGPRAGQASRRAPSKISSAGSRRASSRAAAFTTGPTSSGNSATGCRWSTPSGRIAPPASSQPCASPRSSVGCVRCPSPPAPTR